MLQNKVPCVAVTELAINDSTSTHSLTFDRFLNNNTYAYSYIMILGQQKKYTGTFKLSP